MSSQKVEKYLRDKTDSIKDATTAGKYQELESLYVKKHWNQLSILTKQLVNDREFIAVTDLNEFYDNFIKDFEHRIQALQLIELITPIAEHKFNRDKQSAFEFLKKFEKIVEDDNAATVMLKSCIIKLHILSGNLQLAREMIESTAQKMNKLVEVGPVQAAFYKVAAAYQQQVANYAGYYTDALRYLGCEDLQNLLPEEQHQQALHLSVAALLGENVYNFGELLAHPILKALEGGPRSWLIDVLQSLNAGDWNAFQKHKQRLEAEAADFKKNMPLLEQKLRILCLMEMAVKLPPKQRTLSFDKIAKGAHLGEDEVELLLMKALAKGLIRGKIDQVSGIVNIEWVQPRVLSTDQIRELAERMNLWSRNVGNVAADMQLHANDVIISYSK